MRLTLDFKVLLCLSFLLLTACQTESVYFQLKNASDSILQFSEKAEGKIMLIASEKNWDIVLICSPYAVGLEEQKIDQSLIPEILPVLESSKIYYLFVIKEKEIIERKSLDMPISVPLQKGYLKIMNNSPVVYWQLNREKNHLSLFENTEQIQVFKSGDPIF